MRGLQLRAEVRDHCVDRPGLSCLHVRCEDGSVDTGNGRSLVVGTGGGLHTVFGDDAWKWMLTGPVTADD